MAVQKTKLEAKETKKKRTVQKRTPKKRTNLHEAFIKDEVQEMLSGSKEGLTTFREAVAEELKKNDKAIARKLIARSKAGDVRCTKMAIDLVKDRDQERTEKKNEPTESTAVEIGAEPEWGA